jgi:hypothetical protein
MTMPLAVPLAPPSARRWGRELVELLAVGGATPLLFPISWLMRRKLGLDDAELAAGFTTFYAAHLVNDPHFSVTYLLFYKDVRVRVRQARWLLAGVVAPIVLGGWALTGLAMKSALVLGWLIQLMFLLVGWHYVKQGFGVMMVLAARRGVLWTRGERIAILAHCYAGWAYAWANPWDPGRELEEKGVVYTSIAHPRWLESLALAVLLGTIVPLAFVLVRKWRREGRLPILTPLTAMLVSVWAWSIYSAIDPVVRYVIPALHSVQYLYLVWMMKRNQAREREGPPWFEMAAPARLGLLAVSALGLGWVLFHGAPTFLDDLLVSPREARTSPLGVTPYFAALYACVNLHHYVMDSVTWRRDNPETRFLRSTVSSG